MTLHLSTIVIAVIASIMLDGGTLASTYRTKTSGSWNQTSTWQIQVFGMWVDAHSYPQNGDVALIRQHTTTLTHNEQVSYVIIEHNGMVCTGAYSLDISGYNGLTIHAAGGHTRCGVLSVDTAGELQLTGSGSLQNNGELVLEERGVLLFDGAYPYTLTGSGSIRGNHYTASIAITNGVVITNRMLIQGSMMIDGFGGEGLLINYGASAIIRASGAGGALLLGSNVDLVDDNTIGTPRYESIGGSMVFSREEYYPGLIGNFLIDDCGTMCFEQIIATEGDLDHKSGSIIVAPDAFFQFDSGLSVLEEGTHTIGECEPAECDCD